MYSRRCQLIVTGNGSDGIYTDQQNYDNPSSRFFSGASDETHQAMVRQQYERK